MKAARRVAAALALALAGCMVGPDYRRPSLDLPGAFPEYPADAAIAAGLEVPANWWRLYGDATLDDLVQSGFAKNADIRAAVARIEEAEAALREAGAAFYPEVDLNSRGSRQRLSGATRTIPPGLPLIRNDIQLIGSTAFELDFWGRLRRGVESVRAQVLGTRYARDVTALTLAAAITQTYFALRSLDAQINVTTETLRLRGESLEVVRARAQAGLISDLDVNQAEGAYADAAAQLKELQRQRFVLEHQLGPLTGMLALRIEPADVRALPVPLLPPPGLPSTLLERRPDVRQAEQQLISANALIGVARAAQFPTFSLTGSFGRQSADLADLFTSPARVWSAGLGLVFPIIDAGRYAARTEQAQARQRQAAAAYQRVAETAFREVADALSNVQQTAATEADLRERVSRARNTLQLAQLRYKSGYSAFLEVLDAQRTVNEAELALVRNRQAHLAYTVDLMRALGGGWSPGQPIAGR